MFWILWPRGMWDLSSLTRDCTRSPCFGRSLNHWTAEEVSDHTYLLRTQLCPTLWQMLRGTISKPWPQGDECGYELNRSQAVHLQIKWEKEGREGGTMGSLPGGFGAWNTGGRTGCRRRWWLNLSPADVQAPGDTRGIPRWPGQKLQKNSGPEMKSLEMEEDWAAGVDEEAQGGCIEEGRLWERRCCRDDGEGVAGDEGKKPRADSDPKAGVSCQEAGEVRMEEGKLSLATRRHSGPHQEQV